MAQPKLHSSTILEYTLDLQRPNIVMVFVGTVCVSYQGFSKLVFIKLENPINGGGCLLLDQQDISSTTAIQVA